MNRLFALTIIFLISRVSYGTEDSQCFSTESERLKALAKIRYQVAELLPKNAEFMLLDELSSELARSLPDAIKDEPIMINGPGSLEYQSTISHSCIASYNKCGGQGSVCYLHLFDNSSFCKKWGLVCE